MKMVILLAFFSRDDTLIEIVLVNLSYDVVQDVVQFFFVAGVECLGVGVISLRRK